MSTRNETIYNISLNIFIQNQLSISHQYIVSISTNTQEFQYD